MARGIKVSEASHSRRRGVFVSEIEAKLSPSQLLCKGEVFVGPVASLHVRHWPVG